MSTPLPGHPACTNTSYSMGPQKVMIRALTWNVGGTDPRDEDESKQEIIRSVTKRACANLKDGALLVIGIQEVIPPNQSSNRKKDVLSRTRAWENCFLNCDSELHVLERGVMSSEYGVSLILLSRGASNFSVTRGMAIVIRHDETLSHGYTTNATIGTQVSFGRNNGKTLSISVSRLPAYLDELSEFHRLQKRDACIAYAYEKIHKGSQDILWIGDMNYSEGLRTEWSCYDAHFYDDFSEEALYSGMTYDNYDRNKVLRSLKESSIYFNATHKPKDKKPYEYAFTDRILFASGKDTGGLSPLPKTYGAYDVRNGVSDHLPVTHDFEFGGGQVPGETECRICGLPRRTVV